MVDQVQSNNADNEELLNSALNHLRSTGQLGVEGNPTVFKAVKVFDAAMTLVEGGITVYQYQQAVMVHPAFRLRPLLLHLEKLRLISQDTP